MRYRALACDYDGTLATHGVVDEDTVAALVRWKSSGRKLLLVTGRELPELKNVFPQLALCDYVVAENGGLLYMPETGEERLVATAPPPEFCACLAARGVAPVSTGRSIVATWHPHENAVLETIQELGLELQVIFNKGAVMILPTGVNKATGLAAALTALELSRHEVVAVGDAENDHAFLRHARIGAAVDNALTSLKQHAEIVTAGDHGRGVQELIARILGDELSEFCCRLERYSIPLSQAKNEADPETPRWFPGEQHLLLQGEGDAAPVVAELSNSLASLGYQYCQFIVDDCQSAPSAQEGAETLVDAGSRDQLPTAEEVQKHLAHPQRQVRVWLCAQTPDDRRQRLGEIVHRLQALIHERGRPHVVLLPAADRLATLGLSAGDLSTGFPSIVAQVADESAAPKFDRGQTLVSCSLSDWASSPPRPL